MCQFGRFAIANARHTPITMAAVCPLLRTRFRLRFVAQGLHKTPFCTKTRTLHKKSGSGEFRARANSTCCRTTIAYCRIRGRVDKANSAVRRSVRQSEDTPAASPILRAAASTVDTARSPRAAPIRPTPATVPSVRRSCGDCTRSGAYSTAIRSSNSLIVH
jgi:hypothetical protein